MKRFVLAWAVPLALATAHGHAGTSAPQGGDSSTVAARTASEPVVVKVGDGVSLSHVFDRNGISPATLITIVRTAEHGERLERLRPGDRIELHRAPNGRLDELILRPSVEHAWRFSRRTGGFTSRLETIALEPRVAGAQGVITGNLYDAARAAGMSNALVVALAGVFEWDLDMSRDLRKGATFKVVYQELWLDGRKVRDGAVLAAELVNGGQTFRAVRYRDPEGRVGYFTPEGNSVQKAFLRSPMEFARVSSRYSGRRVHPVLHTVRAHRGVDYAAPTGTPVRATADGIVRLAGGKGGYGRTVIIAHGGQRTTLYAHLSRFARDMKAGRRVRQGEVIGYVGSTGLATGPHLHYEFHENGAYRDPMTVHLPAGRPVPARWRGHFELQTAALAERLEGDGPMRLAVR